MDHTVLLNSIIKVSKKAGKAILNIYNDKNDFLNISYKKDNSPLTLADTTSNKIICDTLNTISPEIPVLSEEGKNIIYAERKDWSKFWLIDPLDGTKEFIKRNGEFTVNIALINNGIPILGVVHAPVLDITWYGCIENGSFKLENGLKPKNIKVNTPNSDDTVKIVSSRSHADNPKLEKYLTQFNKYKLVKMGSSIKICLIADGSAHLYPRFGPTMEWDTAAAHAVVKYAGGNILNLNSNKELCYNKANLLNPAFVVNYS